MSWNAKEKPSHLRRAYLAYGDTTGRCLLPQVVPSAPMIKVRASKMYERATFRIRVKLWLTRRTNRSHPSRDAQARADHCIWRSAVAADAAGGMGDAAGGVGDAAGGIGDARRTIRKVTPARRPPASAAPPPAAPPGAQRLARAARPARPPRGWGGDPPPHSAAQHVRRTRRTQELVIGD
eukprot:gene17102-biopygen11055